MSVINEIRYLYQVSWEVLYSFYSVQHFVKSLITFFLNLYFRFRLYIILMWKEPNISKSVKNKSKLLMLLRCSLILVYLSDFLNLFFQCMFKLCSILILLYIVTTICYEHKCIYTCRCIHIIVFINQLYAQSVWFLMCYINKINLKINWLQIHWLKFHHYHH